MARESPESLPAIKLGRTENGNLYAINHHDVILGCKQAGSNTISEINVVILENFKGSSNILLAHFIEILENESLNPVSIYDTIDYLEEKLQLTKSQIIKMMHINGTPFEKLILSSNNNNNNNFMSVRSIEQLQIIVNQLSQRKNMIPSQICVPLYVIAKIARIQNESHQLQLILQIQADLEAMSDGTFAWTTPEQIDSMIRFIRQDATHEENNREESMVATSAKTKDVGEKNNTRAKESKKKKQEQKKTTQRTKTSDDNDEETGMIQKSIPNMIIIPDEKTGKPSMLVNKRTGAVARIEPSDHKEIIKTVSVGTKTLYSIPLEVQSHLKLGDGTQVMHKNFDTIPQLAKALQSFSKDAKLSLFWSVVQKDK